MCCYFYAPALGSREFLLIVKSESPPFELPLYLSVIVGNALAALINRSASVFLNETIFT